MAKVGSCRQRTVHPNLVGSLVGRVITIVTGTRLVLQFPVVDGVVDQILSVERQVEVECRLRAGQFQPGVVVPHVALMASIGDGEGRLAAIVALAVGVCGGVVERQRGTADGTGHRELERRTVVVADKRHFAVAVGVSAGGELLQRAGEVGVVDERFVDLFVLAVGLEEQTLCGAVVDIVGTQSNGSPAAQCEGYVGSRREVQVHQFVLVAQVLVLGIVGGGVVEACAQGDATADVDAYATRQSVDIEVLGARVGERVFHDVERQMAVGVRGEG